MSMCNDEKKPKFDNLFLFRMLELKIGILCVLYWSQKITKNVVRQPKRLQKIVRCVALNAYNVLIHKHLRTRRKNDYAVFVGIHKILRRCFQLF